uniref:Uncharacterized protein n=1 Tax=Tanacetum cinerariifolium TaxID=118510 RepID=A0A699J5H2_TANCI|nr:hypothetical protein [Tanacetum cinerariifolium]
MTGQLLDSLGPIPNKTSVQALEATQTMADHSRKWHDGLNNRKVRNGTYDEIVAIANKLDSLERYMKKLKENVHAIQVGCKTCVGAHLDKECLLHEEVESIKGVKTEMEDWMKKLQESKDYKAKATNEVPNSSIGQCKAIFANNEAPRDETSSNGTNELHEVCFIFDHNVQVSKKIDEGSS